MVCGGRRVGDAPARLRPRSAFLLDGQQAERAAHPRSTGPSPEVGRDQSSPPPPPDFLTWRSSLSPLEGPWDDDRTRSTAVNDLSRENSSPTSDRVARAPGWGRLSTFVRVQRRLAADAFFWQR